MFACKPVVAQIKHTPCRGCETCLARIAGRFRGFLLGNACGGGLPARGCRHSTPSIYSILVDQPGETAAKTRMKPAPVPFDSCAIMLMIYLPSGPNAKSRYAGSAEAYNGSVSVRSILV